MSDLKPKRVTFPAKKDKDHQTGTVTENEILNPTNPENKLLGHLQIHVPKVEFSAGDVVMVVPDNDDRQVERALRAFGVDANYKVNLNGHETTAGEVFKNGIEIIRATTGLLGTLEVLGKEGKINVKDLGYIERALEEERRAVKSGDKDAIEKARKGRAPLENSALADLISHFRIEGLTIEQLLQPLNHKKLGPRAYTISSSPLVHADAVHITFARVTLDTPLGNSELQKYGVATGFMEGLRTGDNMKIFLNPPNTKFHLPDKITSPLIFIGPGTGAAPFRAMVQEIGAKGNNPDGKPVVFFGGGSYNVDKLYEGEFTEAYKGRILTQPPEYAITREGDNRRRVQALLVERQTDVKALLDDGAIVYVCGSKQMGHQIKEVLEKISPELAKEAGRFREDTY